MLIEVKKSEVRVNDSLTEEAEVASVRANMTNKCGITVTRRSAQLAGGATMGWSLPSSIGLQEYESEEVKSGLSSLSVLCLCQHVKMGIHE